MMKELVLVLIAISLCSCHQKLKDEITDRDLSIQVSRGESEGEFNVRIFYKMNGTVAERNKLTEKMMYKADSNFYKSNGSRKLYADAVIPVANGVKDCFEYVVIFNNSASNFSYQDKYISGKTYQLSLK